MVDQVEIERFFWRPHHEGRTRGRSPVVVEEVGELGEQDLLKREPGAVVPVAAPPDPVVVAHHRDRPALVELVVAGKAEHVGGPCPG